MKNYLRIEWVGVFFFERWSGDRKSSDRTLKEDSMSITYAYRRIHGACQWRSSKVVSQKWSPIPFSYTQWTLWYNHALDTRNSLRYLFCQKIQTHIQKPESRSLTYFDISWFGDTAPTYSQFSWSSLPTRSLSIFSTSSPQDVKGYL